MARVRPSGPRRSRRLDGAAPRAGQVPGDRQLEPRRVLHGPGGRAQAPDPRERRHDRSRRPHRRPDPGRRRGARARPERRAAPVLSRSAGAAAGRRGDPPAERDGAHAGAGEVPRRLLPSDRLAGRHAAGDRSGPSLSPSGQPLALPDRVAHAVGAVAASASGALGRPHSHAGGAALRAASGPAGRARLHPARARDPPLSAAHLSGLHDRLVSRDPRDSRRRSRGAGGPRRGLADGDRGESSRPADGHGGPLAVRRGSAARRSSRPSSKRSSSSPRTCTRRAGSSPSRICSSSTRRWTCRD